MKKFLSVIAFCMAMICIVSLCGCAGTATGDDEQASAVQTYSERLESCKEQIAAITDFQPQIVLVLGTGLGDFANTLDIKETIPYADIEGWPIATAPEHAGNLIFAEYQGLKLAVMQGRIHYYEGYTMEEVVMPLRVLHLLGADTAILSNAVGSLNPDFKVGEFVCVKDQISSFIPSPLIGENDEELGERFVEMTNAFDQEMQDTLLKIGQENDIPVHSGVYLEVPGPQFETPAEIEMYRSLGADTIAMSLCDEVIAARQMGMKVCGINVISNMGAGMDEGFSQDSIEASMKETTEDFQTLIDALLDSLAAK